MECNCSGAFNISQKKTCENSFLVDQFLLLFCYQSHIVLLHRREEMRKPLKRTPRHYDGTEVTAKALSDLLPQWMKKVQVHFQDRPDLVLLAWPEIIGEKLAGMTGAVSFVEGVLTVKVKNSSLYSLLVQHEKTRLLELLQKKFPTIKIRNIVFRLG